MPKGTINSYDAFALLNSRRLYPNQLNDVLIEESKSVYRFSLVQPHKDFVHIYEGSKMENGYMLVAYDITKLDFVPTTASLENERKVQRQEMLEDLTKKYKSSLQQTRSSEETDLNEASSNFAKD